MNFFTMAFSLFTNGKLWMIKRILFHVSLSNDGDVTIVSESLQM